MRSAVNKGHATLQQALRREYPERYPRVCGPDGIVLTRSPWMVRTCVPLQLGGQAERLEIEIGVFNPGSSSPFKPDEHAYVRYYTGTGYVCFIDPIYPLLWGESSKAPIIEKYREDEIDQALAEKYALFPFSEDLATQFNLDLWCDGSGIPASPSKDYKDMRAAMHDQRALADVFVTDSGDERKYGHIWGQRTARVLHAVGGAALSPEGIDGWPATRQPANP